MVETSQTSFHQLKSSARICLLSSLCSLPRTAGSRLMMHVQNGRMLRIPLISSTYGPCMVALPTGLRSTQKSLSMLSSIPSNTYSNMTWAFATRRVD